MSDDGIGLVLLATSLAFTGLGVWLAIKGLNKLAVVTEKTAEAAKTVESVAVQQRADEQNGQDGRREIAAATVSVDGAIGEIKSGMVALTGPLAPSRVVFGFAFLALLASLSAFDVVTFTAGVDTGSGTP